MNFDSRVVPSKCKVKLPYYFNPTTVGLSLHDPYLRVASVVSATQVRVFTMLSLTMWHNVHTKFRKNRPTSSTVPIKKEKQMNGMVISEHNCFRSKCCDKGNGSSEYCQILICYKPTNKTSAEERNDPNTKTTVHTLNLSDFCSNTYCHSVVLVVVFVVVVDFIFTIITAATATAAATTTTTADVESELHKLLPCNTMCKAAPRRSDVTNRSIAFARLLLYKEKEGSTKGKNDKRQITWHTGKTEEKRVKEKEHGIAQHSTCSASLNNISVYIFVLYVSSLLINPITVLWYFRLFSFNHDSSRTSWALSRRTPPPWRMAEKSV